MRKNSIITFCCIAALILCYKAEQGAYAKKTFSYLKEHNIRRQNASPDRTKTPVMGEAEQRMLKENENYRHEQKEKVAYLTFDDGPSKVTRRVLKTLKEHDVHATFFLIGSQINDDTKEIIKQMTEEGHTVGIHTFSHKGNEIYRSKEAFLEDFHKAADKITEITGQKPKIFRFPWGSVNKYLGNFAGEIIQELETEGFTYYDWNVSAEDSVGKPTAESILRNINKDYKKYTKPVILMHDSSINELSARMLPQIIETISGSGYQFDTLDNLEPPYQYPRD